MAYQSFYLTHTNFYIFFYPCIHHADDQMEFSFLLPKGKENEV